MENLVRIKLDPHRGGANSHYFLRPRFRISDWPSEPVEIWTSDDDGVNWDKLDAEDFINCFDGPMKILYVELLFDISDTMLLAFFNPDGMTVGAGFEITRYDRIGLGWIAEGVDPKPVPLGWQSGSRDLSNIYAGHYVYGGSLFNHPIGHIIKCPAIFNTPINFNIANPHDGRIQVGFGLGTGMSEFAGVGVTLMGLSETGVDLLVIDDAALDAMSTEIAVRRQKQVTLNGTTPEELD